MLAHKNMHYYVRAAVIQSLSLLWHHNHWIFILAIEALPIKLSWSLKKRKILTSDSPSIPTSWLYQDPVSNLMCVAGEGLQRWGCPSVFYNTSSRTLWHRQSESGESSRRGTEEPKCIYNINNSDWLIFLCRKRVGSTRDRERQLWLEAQFVSVDLLNALQSRI